MLKWVIWGCWGLAVVGCDKDESSGRGPSGVGDGANAARPAGQDPSAQLGASAKASPPEASGTKTALAGADCPKGEYTFDYSKVDLLGLLNQGGGKAKILKQEGLSTCTFDSPPPGNWSCLITQPNVAELQIEQAGINMLMKLQMSGSVSLKYEPAGPGQFKSFASDVSKFMMEGSMTMGGAEVPLPFDKVPQMFGDDGTLWSYECRQDGLHMKAQIAGGNIEHHLKRK